jgi:hypothetical protein
VKFHASVIDATNAVVDASAPSENTASDGRFIFAHNTSAVYDGVVLGGQTVVSDGPRRPNPFIIGGLRTPFIPDLVEGAEAFGLLDGLLATSPEFDALRAEAPVCTDGVLLRLDTGPSGYNDDFEGFDVLLLMNLRDTAASNPRLAVDLSGDDQTSLFALLQGGYHTDQAFGGSGPTTLENLGPYQIYVTLVPEGIVYANVALGDMVVSGLPMTNGDFVYILRDDDHDGVVDCIDECPNSDLGPTVVIGDCNTDIENTLLASGCTILDGIYICASGARNHGQFVSCVAHFTNELVRDGVLSGNEKGVIESCAARSQLSLVLARARQRQDQDWLGEGDLPSDRNLDELLASEDAAKQTASSPARFHLYAPVPNPFNPTTLIRYDLATASTVSLRIYDVTGNLVRKLVDGVHQEADTHAVLWNGTDERGQGVAAGLYFYRLTTESFTAMGKMVLVR